MGRCGLGVMTVTATTSEQPTLLGRFVQTYEMLFRSPIGFSVSESATGVSGSSGGDGETVLPALRDESCCVGLCVEIGDLGGSRRNLGKSTGSFGSITNRLVLRPVIFIRCCCSVTK